eukprot:5312507-Heterocapsa_arctica.AAC.1
MMARWPLVISTMTSWSSSRARRSKRHEGQVVVHDLHGKPRGFRAGPEEVSTMMARWPLATSTVSVVVFEPGPRR